jgi:hypothetical protein
MDSAATAAPVMKHSIKSPKAAFLIILNILSSSF